MDVDSFISLYKVFVRSHLEYAESFWNPHYMYLIDDLEKVQKQATKILRQCRHLNCRQHLEFLNLPTLAFRRNRGDMIEVHDKVLLFNTEEHKNDHFCYAYVILSLIDHFVSHFFSCVLVNFLSQLFHNIFDVDCL